MRVPVVAVALCLAPALVFPQSLGDAARQQSRQRAERPPVARVFTDADLHSGPGTLAAGPSDPSSTPGADDGSAPPRPGAPAKARDAEDAVRARLDREAAERREREDRWRGLARYTRARLEVARREHDIACGPGVIVLSGG